MSLYYLTDWLGIVPIAIVLCFAALGAMQLIKRKSIFAVDRSILLLGGFYLSVIAVFLFFEVAVVNYRPLLIENVLEASYPSSTTMLSVFVFVTAAAEISKRINSKLPRCIAVAFLLAFAAYPNIRGRA